MLQHQEDSLCPVGQREEDGQARQAKAEAKISSGSRKQAADVVDQRLHSLLDHQCLVIDGEQVEVSVAKILGG